MAWTASRVHDPPPLYWPIELLVREGSNNNTKEIEELVSLNRTVYRGVERVYKLWVCRVWVGFWHMVDLTLGTWDMETYWHWVYEVWKHGVWRHIDIGYVGYGDILTLGTWGMETYWHWVRGVWRHIDIGYVGYADILTLGTWGMETYWHWVRGVWRHIDIGYVGYADILTLGTWGMETYWHWVRGVWRHIDIGYMGYGERPWGDLTMALASSYSGAPSHGLFGFHLHVQHTKTIS
jgi:hypothetical protein